MLEDALTSPHLRSLLLAHQWQGKSNHCGPFAAAIVLNALMKTRVTGHDLARELNRPRWIGPLPLIRRIPNWATFPWGVVDALRQHGLRAEWRWATPPHLLHEGLQRGWVLLPIFGQWRPLWAHLAVLAAFHPELGWGFVDSAHPHPNLVWRDAETFLRQWRNYGRMLVLAYP